MSPEQLLKLYVISAYESLGLEAPKNLTDGLGTCIHWAIRGQVASLEYWIQIMQPATPIQEVEEHSKEEWHPQLEDMNFRHIVDGIDVGRVG